MNELDRRLGELLKRAVEDPEGVSQSEIAELLAEGPPPQCTFSENRGSGRMGTGIAVRLEAKGGPPRPGRLGMATEVGIGGLRVKVPGDGPEEGDRLRVLVERPQLGGTSELEGRVVWSRKAKEGREVGVCVAKECSHCWFATLRLITDAARHRQDSVEGTAQ